MLFDINKTNYKYREQFDEFPDIEKHTFEFTKCTCSSTESYVVSTVSRHRNFQPIVACENCGTLRANPYFTKETASHYYSNVYGNVKRSDRKPEELFAAQNKKSLVPFFDDVEADFNSVLDYGGGAGGKTADFRKSGEEVSLYEVEGTYSQYAYDQGILPHDKSRKYDLVVVSHVIEHMLDPVAQMKEVIDNCCEQEGLLFVATPIIDRQRPRQWLQHFHIAHKYYFTRDALVGLMAELGCELIEYNGNDSFLFRVGGKSDMRASAALYAASAKKVRAAIENELRPSRSSIRRFLKFWRPQSHNQAAPRTPELSP